MSGEKFEPQEIDAQDVVLPEPSKLNAGLDTRGGGVDGVLDESRAKVEKVVSMVRKPDPYEKRINAVREMATIAKLEDNFNKYSHKFPSIKWPKVKKKLKANPEKLDALRKLIDRGGEPTVTAQLDDGRFRFDELSADTPKNPRNVDYKQAVDHALSLGAELTDPDVYASFKGKGIFLDMGVTTCWLKSNKSQDPEKIEYAPNGHAGNFKRPDALFSHKNCGLRCSVVV